MTRVGTYSGEDLKRTSELLMALQRLLPFYEENRPNYEIKKVKLEIKKHQEFLDGSRNFW